MLVTRERRANDTPFRKTRQAAEGDIFFEHSGNGSCKRHGASDHSQPFPARCHDREAGEGFILQRNVLTYVSTTLRGLQARSMSIRD